VAITKNSARQYPLVAEVTFTGGTDVTAAGAYEAIDIPSGAIVVGGHLDVTTAFTDDVDIDIGDGVDPDRYSSTIINADAVGRTALTLDGGAADASYTYPALDTIDITIATATAAAGVATLVVEYVMTTDRENEVQD